MFVSLDLMLYYGFWELSLVPMAILIAMYGRKDGPKAALKFFLFTFIPSAPLLVAILWLYARTGTFNFVDAQILTSRMVLSLPRALFWVALAFLFAFAVKVPVFPLHGWLADTFNEAPVAMAMVVAGKLASTRCCASTSGSSLCRPGRSLHSDRSGRSSAFSTARAWRWCSAISGGCLPLPRSAT